MLTIEAAPWRAMVEHAEGCYPEECCGILLGHEDSRTVTAAIACPNVHPGDRARRFLIDPPDLFAAIHRAREENLKVLGFFHSHPDHDAGFSATDHESTWPWVSNVVLAVRGGKSAGAAAYRVEGAGTVVGEELVV